MCRAGLPGRVFSRDAIAVHLRTSAAKFLCWFNILRQADEDPAPPIRLTRNDRWKADPAAALARRRCRVSQMRLPRVLYRFRLAPAGPGG